MILTDDFLLGVSHYEELAIASRNRLYTKFVFHFPQWWKRRKVVKINWVQIQEPREAQEMRSRIIYHFQTRKYG